MSEFSQDLMFARSNRIAAERALEREIERDRNAPLACAIRDNDPKTAHEILSKMNKEQRLKALYARNAEFNTALSEAISKPTLLYLKLLQDFIEIDYNKACTGLTDELPIEVALDTENVDMIYFLLKNDIIIPPETLREIIVRPFLGLRDEDANNEKIELKNRILGLILQYIGTKFLSTYRHLAKDAEKDNKNHFRKSLLKFCGFPETLLPLPTVPPDSFFGSIKWYASFAFMSDWELAQNDAIRVLESSIVEKFYNYFNNFLCPDTWKIVSDYCSPPKGNVQLLFSNQSNNIQNNAPKVITNSFQSHTLIENERESARLLSL